MERYGTHCEQTYRTNFSRSRAKCIDWVKFKLDLTRMAELHIEGLDGTAYTLIAYSKALKQKVRLVIWVMMKENGVSYSMASFKEIMASTYIAKLIFDKCRSIPNRKLISHTIKELFGWQRKAA